MLPQVPDWYHQLEERRFVTISSLVNKPRFRVLRFAAVRWTRGTCLTKSVTLHLTQFLDAPFLAVTSYALNDVYAIDHRTAAWPIDDNRALVTEYMDSKMVKQMQNVCLTTQMRGYMIEARKVIDSISNMSEILQCLLPNTDWFSICFL